MEKRNYTHIQELLPQNKAMLAEGKTQREVAEHYGFKDKYVVKQLLTRERRKERRAGGRDDPAAERTAKEECSAKGHRSGAGL